MSRDPDDRWLLWRTGIKIIIMLVGISVFFSGWGSRGDGTEFLGLTGMVTGFLRSFLGIVLIGIGGRGIQHDVRAVIERFRAQR